MQNLLFNENLRLIRAQNKRARDNFLVNHVTQEFEERLLLIKRQFTRVFNFSNGLENCDLAQSLLLLQHENDVQGHFTKAYKALIPDGFFLIGLLGGETLQELRYCFLEAETALGLPSSPHIAPLISAQTLGSLLQQSGFALPVTDSEKLTLTYENSFALYKDLRRFGLTNVLNMQRKSFTPRALFMKVEELYQQHFNHGNGRIYASFELLYGSAWKPHASQQKPLKRGSAKHSFENMLKGLPQQ